MDIEFRVRRRLCIQSSNTKSRQTCKTLSASADLAPAADDSTRYWDDMQWDHSMIANQEGRALRAIAVV